MRKIRCGICGYDMTLEDETEILVNINVAKDHKDYERVKQMFGKTKFNCCLCCFIKAFGFKGVKKVSEPSKGEVMK